MKQLLIAAVAGLLATGPCQSQVFSSVSIQVGSGWGWDPIFDVGPLPGVGGGGDSSIRTQAPDGSVLGSVFYSGLYPGYQHTFWSDVLFQDLLDEKYQQTGGAAGPLGRPLSETLPSADGHGFLRRFEFGDIYFDIRQWTSPYPGPFAVHGDIYKKWTQMGRETGVLGYPTYDAYSSPFESSVRTSQSFQGGQIIQSPLTQTHEVHGAIHQEYRIRDGALRLPITDELSTPDGVGRYNDFQGGSIYYTPETGAIPVYSPIQQKWSQLGRQAGAFGYPVQSPQAIYGGGGDARSTESQYQVFEHGEIWWKSGGPAFGVQGAILEKWKTLFRFCLRPSCPSSLGLPISDELTACDGVTRYTRFEHGTISWHPSRGTWVGEPPFCPPAGPGPGTVPPASPARLGFTNPGASMWLEDLQGTEVEYPYPSQPLRGKCILRNSGNSRSQPFNVVWRLQGGTSMSDWRDERFEDARDGVPGGGYDESVWDDFPSLGKGYYTLIAFLDLNRDGLADTQESFQFEVGRFTWLTPGGSSNPFVGSAEPAPSLHISSVSGSIVLQWPSSALGFSLASRNAAEEGSWQQVVAPVVDDGRFNHVTLPASKRFAFFQLVR